MMLDPKANSGANTMPKPSALKIRNQQQAKPSQNEEYTAILKYLSNAIGVEGYTPKQFWGQADKDFNGVLRTDQLKEQVKVLIPG